MKKLSAYILLIVILLCAACAPSDAMQDALPETEPFGAVSTEPSELPENAQNVPAGNADTSISNLLTEINLNGKIQPGQVTPPGTLPDVSQIPPADQSIVGEAVTVNLGSNQPSATFLFRFDEQRNKGMIAVVLSANVPLLVILETDLNITTLCQALTSGADFGAVVISATNISSEEGLYTSFNPSLNDLRPEEIVDLRTPVITDPAGVQFIGRFGGKTTPLLCKYNMNLSNISESLCNKHNTFSKIFSRFSISF